MGKTYFLLYLISVFIQYDSTLLICDPKRSLLKKTEKYLKLQRASIECTKEGIARNIRLAKETMFRRNKLLANSEESNFDSLFGFNFKPFFLIIDNFSDYLAFCEEEMHEEVIEDIKKILLYGEKTGVFVILTTQNCDPDIIPSELYKHFDFKAVLGYVRHHIYKRIFGKENAPDSVFTVPSYGFAAVPYYSEPFKFSVPFIKNTDKLLDCVCRERLYRNLHVKQIDEDDERLIVEIKK